MFLSLTKPWLQKELLFVTRIILFYESGMLKASRTIPKPTTTPTSTTTKEIRDK